ncbi:MAG: DUF3347 domain-containing protein [Mesonia sp.]|uniref:DUF3347 domain-containing protein n=2 Tax=Mesonia sp. TaxID=1960830 RepID=UPI003F9956CF
MKRNLIFTATFIFSISLIACKNDNKTKEEVQKDTQKEKVVEKTDKENEILSFSSKEVEATFLSYRKLKRSLVNSNVEEANFMAKQFLKENPTKDKDIQKLITRIANSSDLEEQRTTFSTLTKKMESFLSGNIESGEIYKQFCPMAFNNKGGFWLATNKEIMNPYFGDKMLHCGSVKETIK